MIRTLLIANRGEIACRIARTARRMGIATIAVYSEADAQALHIAAADRATAIGPAPARQSYLDGERILAAARASGATAIHPGYGFLSENADFAQSVLDAGLIWVGPPPEAMRAMGSKAGAKALMAQSSVPLLDGYHGEAQEPELLASHAARIGYPVVIKAVSGGGGRGMRVVRDPADFAEALAQAQQEGATAFGDARVLIERYLDHPRHVEVQVFADTLGHAVHLFERDCSAQRRHQKVLEEAPAPHLPEAMRQAMGDAAVAAARAVGYVGAGTVEFVVQDDGFFFLEMNTRLQVEHPVTEAITGLDLVEWQLRIADGEALPLRQEEIRCTGHAIEARLYAEDPARDFAPSIGRLAGFRLPAAEAGVRIDTGYAQGDTVGVHYDAMLAKLICHGATRAEALARLRQALAETAIVGVAHNLDLLGRILGHAAFQAGGIDTGFIARESHTLLGLRAPSPEILAIAALAVLAREQAGIADPQTPFAAADGWWLNAAPTRTLSLRHGDRHETLRITPQDGGWKIEAGGETFLGTMHTGEPETLSVTLNGTRRTVLAGGTGSALALRIGGESYAFRLPDPLNEAGADAATANRLAAPVPGQVTAVHVAAGDRVEKGAVLVVLEAMKTVFRLTAPAAGTIAAIACAPGDAVADGQILVRFADPG
ncbi:MAG: ATP-grasp domain-containing protein [Rhodospirillales bacterium]|nr:ATP-grasp domain-containing protein [Rhodospirillales bacterium]